MNAFQNEIEATIIGVDGDTITIQRPNAMPMAMTAAHTGVVLQAAGWIDGGTLCKVTVTNGLITAVAPA